MASPLEAELADRDYAIDDAALDAYVEKLGQMGGAAACAAIGAAPAAPLCGYIGGEVAKLIKSAVPVAKGSTFDDMIVDTWKVVSAKARDGARRIAAVRAYLARRDAVLEGIPQAKRLQASLDLDKRGAHDVPQLWRPSASRWAAWQDWAQEKNAGIPEAHIKEAKRAQQLIGVPWTTYLQLTYSPWVAPVGAPGERVDWSAVAEEPYAIQWARTARLKLDLAAPIVKAMHPHTLGLGGSVLAELARPSGDGGGGGGAHSMREWPVLPW